MALKVWDPKKLLKIVNYQNCQKNVLSQLEKVGGHQYPPGSLSIEDFTWEDDYFIQKHPELLKHCRQHLSQVEGHANP